MEIFKKKHRITLITFLLFVIIYESVIAILLINQPLMAGDEGHFVKTIRNFGEGITINLLKNYEEMSSPLPFILYALWGRIFDFSLFTLRTFSLIVAFLTFLIFYEVTLIISNRPWISLGAVIFFAANPYIVFLTILIFTDMLTILFVILSLYAILRNKQFLLLLALAGGLLCRQYFVFLILAMGIFIALTYLSNRKTETVKFLSSVFLSVIPIIGLFFLWGGASPDNERRLFYQEGMFTYHLNALTLYIVILFVYLSPLIFIFKRNLYYEYKTIGISLLLSFFYWLFPIKTSSYSIAAGIQTTGLFHRFLRMIVGAKIENFIFFLAFFLCIPILIRILLDIFEGLKNRNYNLRFLFGLCIISYLLVMPFSYIYWEKYILIVLPLSILWTLQDIKIKTEKF